MLSYRPTKSNKHFHTIAKDESCPMYCVFFQLVMHKLNDGELFKKL